MSELPPEEVPAASDAVHEAASGRVIHITEGGLSSVWQHERRSSGRAG